MRVHNATTNVVAGDGVIPEYYLEDMPQTLASAKHSERAVLVQLLAFASTLGSTARAQRFWRTSLNLRTLTLK